MATSTTERSLDRSALQGRTLAIGHEIFERIGSGPRPWQRAWWDDRLMNLSLGEPAVKVQLFRLIDAMPALRTTEAVRRHLVSLRGSAKTTSGFYGPLAVGTSGGRMM